MNRPSPALSRRGLLASALAAAALPTIPSRAFAGMPLGREILADPDFSRLRAVDPYVIGVRPYRKGGVRLELERVGGKPVVHHYGHGGAGITLAWGTAAAAVELVDEARRASNKEVPSLAVIGTGVVGLATATALRRRYPTAKITLYARDLDVRSTTSWVAGGQFEPSGVWREYDDAARRPTLDQWLRTSRDRILELQRAGTADAHGIAERDNFTLDHDLPAMDEHTPRDVIPAYDRGILPFSYLQVIGRRYRTWLVNPTILLPRLAADLAAAGVTSVQRSFGALAELGTLPEDIVVNCTGYGAKALAGDAAVIPQRGHLVVLDKTDARQRYFFGGGCDNGVVFYVFCRQNDIVVGGTVLSGQDGATIGAGDDAVFRKLLGNAREMFGGNPGGCAL